MPYMIDGHNLIPKAPGLSLTEIDDEMALVELLVAFCRQERKQAEVYFDNAPPGGRRVQKFGALTAHFVRQGISADQAIHNRLGRLGKEARNWTVVSSDRAVQSSARGVRAQVISSEDFAARLSQEVEKGIPDRGEDPAAALSEAEVEDWLDIFSDRPEE